MNKKFVYQVGNNKKKLEEAEVLKWFYRTHSWSDHFNTCKGKGKGKGLAVTWHADRAGGAQA